MELVRDPLLDAVTALASARDEVGVCGIVRRAARELSGADGVTFVLRKGNNCYYADEDSIAPLWKGRQFPMETWLQQVLNNVVSNAIKFSSRGGRVEVHVARDGSLASVVVQDQGTGVPPEFLPFMFDRFRQADASMTRRQGGLGLGLTIVRDLVALHGGTVRAESAGKDRGTTIHLEFAVAEEPKTGGDVHRTQARTKLPVH